MSYDPKYYREWYKKNKTALMQRRKAYYQKNKARLQAYQRAYIQRQRKAKRGEVLRNIHDLEGLMPKAKIIPWLKRRIYRKKKHLEKVQKKLDEQS